MKTLVIHPKDDSTQFLDILYEKIPNKTIVTNGVTKDELRKLIKEHDRVIMCGHGTPSGLMSVGRFPNAGGYIIEQTFVPLLNEKSENIFIWCNADKFVERFNLKGFYSGMFISEVGESEYCGVPSSQEVVDESNYSFVEIFSKYVNEGVEKIYESVRNDYGLLCETNKVATYNHNRLYLNL